MPGTEPFWGEIHTHTALSDGNGSPEDNFEIAKSHLDFWAMADHAYDKIVFDLDYRERKPDHEILHEEWGRIQNLCREYEKPGAFVPFLAYEWTNFRFGHHNVYYLDYDQPLRMPATLPELYDALRDVEALAIPHHTAYPVGVCGKNWDYHDDDLSPFVEIYSLHGSSEEPGKIDPILTYGSWMGPGATGGSVQEGLARGYRLGIMASSDSHGDHPGAYDNGLIAAYADNLSRASLWEAMKSRRIYGVTGDRITLDFSINGRPMGSALPFADKREINASVVAWDKIDRIDIIKNNKIIHSFAEPTGNAAPQDKLRFRFMLEWGWDNKDDREWDGALKLTGGRILRAAPCFRGSVAHRAGRGITAISDSECTWKSMTEKVKSPMYFRRFADAITFEVECRRDDGLDFALACGGIERKVTVAPEEILAGAAVNYLEDIPSVDNGSYWRSMESRAKFKIHQGWLTDQLTVDVGIEDDAGEPGPQDDFYYVRVIQRNRQRAWSSPIWVERKP
ncbi:MAG: hypothetical protein GXP25_12855 [Planctomycetes bacterium]|nr:hypothetical protein [Planctomycetota bacterium]